MDFSRDPVPALRLGKHAVILLAVLVLGSASGRSQTRAARDRPPSADRPLPSPSAAAGTVPPSSPDSRAAAPRSDSLNYRLLTNDLVNIQVFQEDDLQSTERISRDGTISFPFIGTVSLAGKTLQESAEILQARLREYLVHPQVTVRVAEYSKRRFTVLGQVTKPGVYELPNDSTLTLLEAIGMAGGYTRIANSSKITLKRQSPHGEETLMRLDGASMARDKTSQRFEVQPGDTIMVGESFL